MMIRMSEAFHTGPGRLIPVPPRCASGARRGRTRRRPVPRMRAASRGPENGQFTVDVVGDRSYRELGREKMEENKH